MRRACHAPLCDAVVPRRRPRALAPACRACARSTPRRWKPSASVSRCGRENAHTHWGPGLWGAPGGRSAWEPRCHGGRLPTQWAVAGLLLYLPELLRAPCFVFFGGGLLSCVLAPRRGGADPAARGTARVLARAPPQRARRPAAGCPRVGLLSPRLAHAVASPVPGLGGCSVTRAATWQAGEGRAQESQPRRAGGRVRSLGGAARQGRLLRVLLSGGRLGRDAGQQRAGTSNNTKQKCPVALVPTTSPLVPAHCLDLVPVFAGTRSSAPAGACARGRAC